MLLAGVAMQRSSCNPAIAEVMLAWVKEPPRPSGGAASAEHAAQALLCGVPV